MSTVAVFGTDSSRMPGRPAPMGCSNYSRRGAQLAPTHPGSASPRFPAQGSLGLPVTQYSSVRSCCYPPSNKDRRAVAGSRRVYCQRRLRPGRLLPLASSGFFWPSASCVRRDGSACAGQRAEACSASVAIIVLITRPLTGAPSSLGRGTSSPELCRLMVSLANLWQRVVKVHFPPPLDVT